MHTQTKLQWKLQRFVEISSCFHSFVNRDFARFVNSEGNVESRDVLILVRRCYLRKFISCLCGVTV